MGRGAGRGHSPLLLDGLLQRALLRLLVAVVRGAGRGRGGGGGRGQGGGGGGEGSGEGPLTLSS